MVRAFLMCSSLAGLSGSCQVVLILEDGVFSGISYLRPFVALAQWLSKYSLWISNISTENLLEMHIVVPYSRLLKYLGEMEQIFVIYSVLHSKPNK